GTRRIALGRDLGRGPAGKARAGDIVVVELSERSRRGGQARVVAVIGRPDVARAVIEALMVDRGLARRFPGDVEREAGLARDRGQRGGEAGGARRDVRSLPTFTIDPTTARDFDDAVSAERIEGGGVRV